MSRLPAPERPPPQASAVAVVDGLAGVALHITKAFVLAMRDDDALPCVASVRPGAKGTSMSMPVLGSLAEILC